MKMNDEARKCRLQDKIARLRILLAKAKEHGIFDAAEHQEISAAINTAAYEVTGAGGIATCPTCPPKAADGSYCITTSCQKELETTCEVGAQTIEAYVDSKGILDRERQDLHDSIVAKFMQGRKCIEGANKRPIAVLTGGAPGSGKSHFIKNNMPWILSGDVAHIDADAVRAELPEYRGWNATLTHVETQMIVARMIESIGATCRTDIVYDGTMNNPQKYMVIIEQLKSLGYEVFVIYMRVDKETSRRRALERYQKTGRYVPSYVIDDFFSKGEKGFNEIKNAVDGWILVDGTSSEVIARGGESIPSVRSYDDDEASASSEWGEVTMMPVKNISTDPKRFQPRADFSEEKVSQIMRTFNPTALTPLTLWRDPATKQYYVLAGHHRLEALRRLGWKDAPVRIFKGTESEAIDFAWTSNVRGRQQTAAENSRYLRKLTEQGMKASEVKSKCQELYDRSCRTVWLLSLLADGSRVLEDMQQFPPASDEYKALETMARWVARIVEIYPMLTASQQNELYRYLRDNYRTAGRKFQSSQQFEEHVERLMAIRFPFGAVTEEPLNLDNLRVRTDAERSIDESIATITKELDEARRDMDKYRNEYLSSALENRSGVSETAYQEGVLKRESIIRMLTTKLLDLRERRAGIVARSHDEQPALF